MNDSLRVNNKSFFYLLKGYVWRASICNAASDYRMLDFLLLGIAVVVAATGQVVTRQASNESEERNESRRASNRTRRRPSHLIENDKLREELAGTGNNHNENDVEMEVDGSTSTITEPRKPKRKRSRRTSPLTRLREDHPAVIGGVSAKGISFQHDIHLILHSH